MSSESRFVALLAGGTGERLWPISRAERPKQFLEFRPGEGSALQQAWDRAAQVVGAEHVLVIAAARHADEVRQQLPGLVARNAVFEPVGRDTGPAALIAALLAQSRAPDAVLAVAPADHYIINGGAWVQSVSRALDVAAAQPGTFALLGVVPPEDASGRFGYIVYADDPTGDETPERPRTVRRFVEKPDKTALDALRREGRCLCSLGTFACSAAAIIAQYRRGDPEAVGVLEAIVGTGKIEQAALATAYDRVRRIAIDRAVLEPSTRSVVLATEIQRIDGGDYAGIAELLPRDAAGNAVLGRIAVRDGANNIVFAPDRDVILIGVENMVVAVSDTGILICSRERTQEIKGAIAALPPE